MTTSNSAPGLHNTNTWLHRWIYYLVCGFMFASVFLRSLLVFQNTPLFSRLLPPLVLWLAVLLATILLANGSSRYSVLPIGMEIVLTLYLLVITRVDFFVFLFAIPCMQVMQQFTQKGALLLLVFSTVLTFLVLTSTQEFLYAISTAVVFFGGGLFLVTYIGSTRRARTLQEQQQMLLWDVQAANDQLLFYSHQLQQLAAGRERQRLARELHDSVTQTLFSMTLTTQSALMLLDRDRKQVAALLERLSHLTHNALAEMQVLISKLAPENLTVDRFISALRNHVDERNRLNDLAIQVEVHGSQSLTSTEAENLYRIVQEALNNITKHACTAQAVVRLNLGERPCLEIEDHGIGFDPQRIRSESQMGLTSMEERAGEIGWTFQVDSSTGNGTRIRVSRNAGG